MPHHLERVPGRQVGNVPFGAREDVIETIANLKPPLLSFVIINWNYGNYVGQVINSISEQTYDEFECLVIDNGSSDNSRDVISKHVGADPRFRTFYLEENLGQLGAAQWALEKVRGDFVTFVDADDLLFPAFAATHLQVHIALPRSVGITSSNAIEINSEGRVLTAGYEDFVSIVENKKSTAKNKQTIRGLKSKAKVLRLSQISEADYLNLHRNTYLIPQGVGGWIWSPGTSNTYRRSLLTRATIEGQRKLLRATDGHFNHICHALGGTAIIDIPLSLYRHHEDNSFSRGESIGGLRRGSRDAHTRHYHERIQTVEVLLDKVDLFDWLLFGRYWSSVDRIADVNHKNRREIFSKCGFKEIFSKHIDKISKVFDHDRLIKEVHARFSLTDARYIFNHTPATSKIYFKYRCWKYYLAEYLRSKLRKLQFR